MTTQEQTALTEMIFQVANLEDAAQNAEDNDQLGRASKFRAQARELKKQIAALEQK